MRRAVRAETQPWMPLLLGGLVLAAYSRIVALSSGTDALVGTFHDDAFYYFQIARNVAAGLGSTFDGIHATNGYHPLWMAVIVPLFGLVPGELGPVIAAGWLEALLCAAAAALLCAGLQRSVGTAAAALGALLVVAPPGAPAILRGGMESALLLVLLVAAWRAAGACNDAPGELRRWLTLGCILALAFLARLEAILFVPAALIVWRAELRRCKPAAAAVVAPSVISLAAFLLWNKAAFSVWLPISGAVKLTWTLRQTPTLMLSHALDIPWAGREALLRIFGAQAWSGVPPAVRLVYVCSIVALLVAAWRYRVRLAASLERAGVAFPVLGCLLMVLVGQALLGGLQPWQRVPLQLGTALVVAAWVAPYRRLAIVGSALLALVLCARPVREAIPESSSSYARWRVAAARWLEKNTAAEDRIGTWNAGMIGYFSRRHVVNLDGLVNDHVFLAEGIRGGRLGDYLDREGIGWIADQACDPDEDLPRYLARGGAADRAAEFELAAFLHAPSGCPGTAVWKRSRTEIGVRQPQ